MTKRKPFEAADRVELVRDRGGLKQGFVGTVTRRMTIHSGLSVNPDPSGQAVFVVFDNVIGMQVVPIEDLKHVAS